MRLHMLCNVIRDPSCEHSQIERRTYCRMFGKRFVTKTLATSPNYYNEVSCTMVGDKDGDTSAGNESQSRRQANNQQQRNHTEYREIEATNCCYAIEAQ
eukprot:scaffold8405_cov169-Amphora_coffeaeformis.AAC.7